MRRSDQGFTLIEMLMVVSLVSLVALAIYSNFASGVRVFKKMNDSAGDEALTLFFDKLSRDFQNAFPYADVPFEGDSEKVSFMTIIKTVPALGGDQGIGRVTYFYDKESGAVLCRRDNINNLFKEKPAEAAALIRGVSMLRMSYFEYDPLEGQYRWKEAWDPEDTKGGAPLAVRLEMEIREEDHERQITRTFAIPVGE